MQPSHDFLQVSINVFPPKYPLALSSLCLPLHHSSNQVSFFHTWHFFGSLSWHPSVSFIRYTQNVLSYAPNITTSPNKLKSGRNTTAWALITWTSFIFTWFYSHGRPLTINVRLAGCFYFMPRLFSDRKHPTCSCTRKLFPFRPGAGGSDFKNIWETTFNDRENSNFLSYLMLMKEVIYLLSPPAIQSCIPEYYIVPLFLIFLHNPSLRRKLPISFF